MAEWCYMATHIWIDIDSDDSLLPDSTKPLPKSMLTNYQWGLHLRTISQKMPKIFIVDINLKIANITLLPHLLEIGHLFLILIHLQQSHDLLLSNRLQRIKPPIFQSSKGIGYANKISSAKVAALTHCGLVMPYGNTYLGQHWLR